MERTNSPRHHKAAKLAEKIGEEIDPRWFLRTAWLKNLESTTRGRTRVRHALRWPPRFLAALSLTRSPVIARKAAVLAYGTYLLQRKEDREFAAQCEAAEEYAAQLLHDVCWKEAVEGHLEPVYFKDELVGHVRKYDTRIQIEMLRAHLPDRFKTAATANVQINTGDT